MKSAVMFLCLFLCSTALFAADRDMPGKKADPAKQGGEGVIKKTEKGAFGLEMVVRGKELKTGTNSFDITVRDKKGKYVKGAVLVITPWMSGRGQGVWEKPAVTERGNGTYHVENVKIVTSGRWDLKVTVKKGDHEDRAVFSFNVADNVFPQQKEPEKKTNYERSIKHYNIPNVTLLNQDGKKVNFRSIIESNKPVIIDFIYTTCTTICPVLSASFANINKGTGANAVNVQLISISIDPENDRPENMKEYLANFKAREGWDYLTGSREDIYKVLRSLDAYITDKMAHEPIYLLHNPHNDEWVRIKGLVRKSVLMDELRRMENK